MLERRFLQVQGIQWFLIGSVHGFQVTPLMRKDLHRFWNVMEETNLWKTSIYIFGCRFFAASALEFVELCLELSLVRSMDRLEMQIVVMAYGFRLWLTDLQLEARLPHRFGGR